MKRAPPSTTSEPAPKKARPTPPSDFPLPPPSLDTSSSTEWTRVEKRKAKKISKVTSVASSNPPSFAYSASELRKRKDAVSISEVRDLALHCVADAPPAGWARLENKANVKGVVVLLVPGLTHDVLGLKKPSTDPTTCPHLPVSVPLEIAASKSGDDEMEEDEEEGKEEKAARLGGVPFISRTFSHALPTRAPGDSTRMHSVLAEFLSAPVTGEEKKRRTLARIQGERENSDKGAEQYLLSVQEMLENGYPLPRSMSDAHQPEDADDWVESTTVSEGEDAEVYALDCEMCITSRGKELARVSVLRIDSNNGEAKVVLDTHVLPGAPITDYLTRFSGITPASLDGCTTTLSDVQSKLLKLLKPSPGQRSPILLGHSLESDLCALKLRHGRCIDTALIYHHPRGRPLKPGLAWLTRKWCGREIQARGEGGHDPEEDARACAELLRRKIENGPGFGTFKTDTEPIFERIARAKNGAVRTAAVDRNPAQGFASRASTATPAANDAAVCAGVVDAVRTGHGFVFGRFTELADALGWVTPKPTDPAVSLEPPPPPPTLKEALDNLTARLAEIHAALPPRTALIVMSGHSDPREMSRLSARRLAFEAYQRAAASKSTHHPSHLPPKPANPFVMSSGATATVVANTGLKVDETDESEVDEEEEEEKPSWTAADARALEEAVAHARRGLLFLGFKN
ncbi:hypothetical protein PENSPDRAFT_759442 [Peniophora sp. CONT]|nr:hypothetical protein PENSPDRAFT_759442 [Peniophora sp. CONT]